MDASTGVFHEETFRNLLGREAARATRYQDFFSLCLVKPDLPMSQEELIRRIERAVSGKIAEFVRVTDMVGRLASGVAVVLLHTAGTDAWRVADRIRSNIEQVAFREGPDDRPRRLTISVGQASFPDDGTTDATLLSQAETYLQRASQGGGNQVASASATPD